MPLFFQRPIPSFQEFSPLFRLMDDSFSQTSLAQRQQFKTYNAAFDVSEQENSYEVQAEVPGFSQDDISIEWTDATTLSISGRTESASEKTNEAAAPAEPKGKERAVSPARSESSSSSYHKPTVADAAEEDGEMSETAGPVTQTKEAEAPVQAQESQRPQPKFWIHERSSGSFHRTFQFPVRIDQENVKASLRNGVLSISVPKVAPVTRRINIE
ncbi:HSP20-like chaperone [Aulographum hederae CBS 113979]|uniref:HSP20-like chaperone n=1 Tax=Aulographum hederae CBS 113979 TaxID=1176131 RepID=A0A6G1GMZ4_9PEZI|nr:HSP20-like chaperone [Aulographum hederae CBS 113979]